MDNRNMAASPYEDHRRIATGLTKLEYAAIATMNGLISSGRVSDPVSVAEMAVTRANALFDELEKNNDI